MPEKTYFIPEQARADVEKLCAHFARKAARYGAALEVSSSAPYVRDVPIIYAPEVDALGLPRSAPVEGYDVTICADIIRRDGFTVAARIEHGDNGNNIVKRSALLPTPGCRQYDSFPVVMNKGDFD